MRAFPLPGAEPQYGPDTTVEVEHIDLYLAPDIAAQRMEGVCTTTVRAIDDGVRDVTLDAVDFFVGSVRDDGGRPLHFRRSAGALTVHLPRPLAAGERTTFAVAYRLEKPRAGLHFIAPSTEHPEKPTECWTQSQDRFARYWFPCIDHPHAKQTTSTTIVVPTGTFALGNGRLAERRDDPATGYTQFRYVQDVPHSTYLVTMVAGSFAEVEQRGARKPVFYYVPPGREAEGERSFGKTPRMLAFFEDRTGMPYPYARYSQIAVADFLFGGMENTTATTQTDRTLHDERAHLDFSSDGLVAHELAHQWFGDLLTTRDWAHAWLNEGFATFFETAFKEHDLGRDEYLYAMYERVHAYVREVRERYARPVVENRFRFPIEIFDRHLYDKGCLVLHMLRGELGDERFWSSIRTYVAAHAGRSVETIDLVRAIEGATGRNTRAFFDQWIFRAGHPDLRVSYRFDRDSGAATIRIEQRQPIDDAHPPYRFDLEIGLLDALPGAVERDAAAAPIAFERRHRVRVEDADHTVSIACAAEPALIRVDPSAGVLCTMELTMSAEALSAIIEGDPSPVARIRAARALAKDPSPAALAALEAALRDDPFWGVRAEVARALGDTRAPRAKELLLTACRDPHPKVRRAAAAALGSFRTAAVVDTLVALALDDPSYFVVESALESLGKTRDPVARDVLLAGLDRPSWGDLIAGGAARGLAEHADAPAVAAIADATSRKRSDELRAEGARALARVVELGGDARDVACTRLEELIDDESFPVRRAAIASAGKTGARRLVPALERAAATALDGRLRRAASEAIAAIREETGNTARVAELQTEVDALRAEVRALRERADAAASL